jgi:hypothetical protein
VLKITEQAADHLFSRGSKTGTFNELGEKRDGYFGPRADFP